MDPTEKHEKWTNMAGSRRMQSEEGINGPPLHRIAQVMRQEQVSIPNAARLMNKSESKIRAEMHSACDMKLSNLYRWQTLLKVPIADLLREPELDLSPHVQLRGSLIKTMRTVRTIQQKARSMAIQTMASRLAEQLTQMMPELENVSAWPVVGQPRRSNELGTIAGNQVYDAMFNVPPTQES